MQFVWEAFYKYIQKINCAHFIDFFVTFLEGVIALGVIRNHRKINASKGTSVIGNIVSLEFLNNNIKKVFNLDDFWRNVFSIEFLGK